MKRQAAGGRVVALCGGIGGAKLALGLASTVPPEDLCIIVNTGDDFDHFGLRICPDIDTVLYTLAGLSDPDRGWGRAGETWRFMESVAAMGGETWFNLGDSDLAIHAVRTGRLRQGERLTEVIGQIATELGLAARILPASDDDVRTVLDTSEGPLPLQHYFVRHRCAPVVRAVRYLGAGTARPSPEVIEALSAPGLGCILICPSNPYLSIDPIFAIASMRDMIAAAPCPRIAVSPIVGGKALKGPLDKMMRELGLSPDQETVLGHYDGLIDHLVVDESDRGERGVSGRFTYMNSVMKTRADKIALAERILEFAGVR